MDPITAAETYEVLCDYYGWWSARLVICAWSGPEAVQNEPPAWSMKRRGGGVVFGHLPLVGLTQSYPMLPWISSLRIVGA